MWGKIETMRVDLVLKSDRGTFSYAAAKDGKIRFGHRALDDGLVLLPSQVLVVVNRSGQPVFYRRDRLEEEKDVDPIASMSEVGYGPVTS
jgi:hypothetical protein